jgi:hypothetical protein
MKLDYEKWHEGIGYDTRALSEMTPEERGQVIGILTARDTTWREVEALAAIDLPEARKAVRQALEHRMSVDTRLAAAQALYEQGEMKDIGLFLARQIRQLTRIDDGLTRALLMAEEHPTSAVKQALLWASWNRTECAPHCAGLICFLAGASKEPFDWSLRPLFLRLGPNNSYIERKAAFDDLCKLVGMELDTEQQ